MLTLLCVHSTCPSWTTWMQPFFLITLVNKNKTTKWPIKISLYYDISCPCADLIVFLNNLACIITHRKHGDGYYNVFNREFNIKKEHYRLIVAYSGCQIFAPGESADSRQEQNFHHAPNPFPGCAAPGSVMSLITKIEQIIWPHPCAPAPGACTCIYACAKIHKMLDVLGLSPIPCLSVRQRTSQTQIKDLWPCFER